MARPMGNHDGPAWNAASITKNDSTDLTNPTRGIYVGATGNLKVTMLSGDIVTFVGLAAGVIHPISAKRVWSTDTTVTGIVGVW